MGKNIERNVLLLVVVVMAALLLLACADPGIPPGTKIRIRSGSPAPRGSQLASPTGIPDPDFNSDSNISDSDTPSVSPTTSMIASEQLVKDVLLKSERAWNEKNSEVFLSLFSEDAQIMVGRKQQIVSKAEYAKILPAAFKEAGIVKTKSLSVDILDTKTAKADSVVYITADGRNLIWITKKVSLVNQKGKWLILKSSFTIYFRGEDPRDKNLRGGETPIESE